MEIQDAIRSNWKELKGKIRQKWARLTDDDIALLQGNAEEFSGKVEKAYNLSKSEVRRQLDDLLSSGKRRLDQVNESIKSRTERDQPRS